MTAADMINWSLALAPVLLMMALFAWLDVFKLMSLAELAGLLALGAAAGGAAYPVSGQMLDHLPLGFSVYSRFVAPWIEEALKALAIMLLFGVNRIGFKIDAALSGFGIGAGFSVVENIIYLTRFPDLTPAVWMVRGLGTAVMHGGTAAVMAALAHEFAERASRGHAERWRLNLLWFVPGYLIAVAAHAAFNQFPDRPMLAMLAALLVVPLALFATFGFGAGEARQWLATESASHRAELIALRDGRFPDTEAGRHISALAARAGAHTTTIREYLEVHTWLVLRAEEMLLDQSTSDDRVTPAELRAGFDRLAALEARLGRTLMSALTPLLPFSRNDLWELSELRQRVG